MSDGEHDKDAPEAKDAPENEAEAKPEGETPEDDGIAPVQGDAEASLPADPMAELEEKLASAKKDTANTKERMLRVAADFENFRRRSVRELDETRARAKMDAVKELLPVFDNLERAIGHADGSDPTSIADGIRMVIKQFVDTLGKLGMERIDAVGKSFDPNLHESIQFEHSEEHAAGIVVSEFHAGYKQGDKLLRPALVVVSRGPKPPEEASAEEASKAAEGEAAPEVAEGDAGSAATADEDAS